MNAFVEAQELKRSRRSAWLWFSILALSAVLFAWRDIVQREKLFGQLGWDWDGLTAFILLSQPALFAILAVQQLLLRPRQNG